MAVASALAVIYTTHHTRSLFADVERLQQTLDFYDDEWVKLQLEQNTLAERSRIEKEAARLGMVLPTQESILYIHPSH